MFSFCHFGNPQTSLPQKVNLSPQDHKTNSWHALRYSIAFQVKENHSITQSHIYNTIGKLVLLDLLSRFVFLLNR